MGIPIPDGSARILRKHTRRVNKSPKNISSPIPGGTSEYTKNAPEGCANCAETSVFQYLMRVPEYDENSPEGWTNHRKTINSTPIPGGTPE